MKKLFAVGLMFATMSVSAFAAPATKDTKFWAGTKKMSKMVVMAPVKGVKRIFKAPVKK